MERATKQTSATARSASPTQMHALPGCMPNADAAILRQCVTEMRVSLRTVRSLRTHASAFKDACDATDHLVYEAVQLEQ